MGHLWTFYLFKALTETLPYYFIELYLTSNANSGINPLYFHTHALALSSRANDNTG